MATYISWLTTMDFPARLIRLRKEKGLTQQQMADAIGLHLTQIKRYESGGSQPSLEALRKIAVALGLTTDSLLFEDTERGPDEALRMQFDVISRMTDEEKWIIRELIDGMILKYQARRWMQPGEPPAPKARVAKDTGRARRRSAARAGA